MESKGTMRATRYTEAMPTIADDGFRPNRLEDRVATATDAHPTNPLAELIDDETYARLEAAGVLYEKGVRDYTMRAAYQSMRARRVAATEAIEQLREAHPYLQYDTVRKIVYARNR